MFDRSAGNAFLVEEILGIVRDDGAGRLPPSLRDLLLARTERLSAEVQAVLRAAVATDRVAHGLLAAVAGLSEFELETAALREAVDLGHALVPDEDHRGDRFRHELVREAIYEELLPGERVRIHTAYAQALDRAYALAEGDVAAASGRARTGTPRTTSTAHCPPRCRSAALASAAYAYPEAERLLELALELWSRATADAQSGMDYPGLLELAAAAALSAGDEQRSLAMLDEALGSLDAESDTRRVARLRWRRAQVLRHTGHDPQPDLAAAMGILSAGSPTPELAGVLAEMAGVECVNFELEHGRELAERAVTVARAVGDHRHESTALVNLGWALAYGGELERGLDAMQTVKRLSKGRETKASC